MECADKIMFNGIPFYRCRDYYRSTVKDGCQALHRVIWESVHGLIPDGFVVHHIDGNPDNNLIENLSCIPLVEHLKHHYPESLPQRTDAIIAWNKSARASECRKKTARDVWAERKANPPSRTCERCGALFNKPNPKARFCSSKCAGEAYYWRKKNERK
jgi:hypothetical protein